MTDQIFRKKPWGCSRLQRRDVLDFEITSFSYLEYTRAWSSSGVCPLASQEVSSVGRGTSFKELFQGRWWPHQEPLLGRAAGTRGMRACSAWYPVVGFAVLWRRAPVKESCAGVFPLAHRRTSSSSWLTTQSLPLSTVSKAIQGLTLVLI